MDEDDFFSDEDLDSIPTNALQALEQHAFSSTQRPLNGKPSQNTVNRPDRFDHNLPWRPSQSAQQAEGQYRPQTQDSHPPDVTDLPVSDDYGLDDEVVIDLNDPSMVIQSGSRPDGVSSVGNLQRSNPPKTSHGSKAAVDPETMAAFAAADEELKSQTISRRDRIYLAQAQTGSSMDVSTLQARIAALEAEHERLRQSEQEARNAALAKQGEISIVRANQQNASREYERRISTLQKQHADEAARQKAELEAGKREREKIQTDNRFLQHEAAQEAEKMKRQFGVTKARSSMNNRETPKKLRKSTIADGFNDDEVQMVSPSRSKEKSREATPKAGAKRKRPVQDSPVVSLSFSQPARVARNDSFEQDSNASEHILVDAGINQGDDRYDYIQRILNHAPYEGHDRTVEALTRYCFPTTSTISLSSLFINGITSSSRSDGKSLPIKTAEVLMGIWSRCLEEKFSRPLYLILDMLRFVLYFELSATSSALAEQAIPLCSRSIDLIAAHVTRALVIPNYGKTVDWAAQEKLAEEVNVDDILDFLQMLCKASSLSAERTEAFWQRIEGTFLVMMLHRALPAKQIVVTLQMLSTSVLATTFGVICEDAETQVKQEHGTVDRLTNLLFETPQPPSDEPAYTDEEITELRIEVLKVLQNMCLTNHCGLLLAHHRSAIGRLIRFLDGQVCKLYSVRPSVGMQTVPSAADTENSQTNLHDLVVQTINMATRLFYHILRTYDNSIDIVQKLSVVQGGYHKFLISLTRIAFSEQLVFEAGIEDEVVEAAHTILDNILSPEVGEAVVQAIETPRGTKGSTTEADSPAEVESGASSTRATRSKKG